MNKLLKCSILYIVKYTGILIISRFLTRKKLRIICYHGFSHADQAAFRSKLFIKSTTFKSRIDSLLRKNYRFLSVSEFHGYLDGVTNFHLPVLLTIDDGWRSTHDMALPVLQENSIPHIIYLYTDCHQKEIPVINVLLQYALWKTSLSNLKWSGKLFNLRSKTERESLLNYLISETQPLDKDALHKKLAEIFQKLEVDYSFNREWSYFSLLNQSEIKDHLRNGGSIQLHTHHHINPLQDDMLTDELEENRRIIENITEEPAVDFCYPSGVYSHDQFSLLDRLKIKTAVTCNPGLNDRNTNPYELNRFLDGENITQIEFEAEMSGLMDILRKIYIRLTDFRF